MKSLKQILREQQEVLIDIPENLMEDLEEDITIALGKTGYAVTTPDFDIVVRKMLKEFLIDKIGKDLGMDIVYFLSSSGKLRWYLVKGVIRKK